MKKILLFGVALFTTLNMYAQGDSTLIKMLPKEGQGYLVLNMVLNNILIDNWKVDIKEKTIDTNNTVTYKIVKKESLYGVEYYTENFKLAKGYDRNHHIQMLAGQIIPLGILVNRFEFSDGSVMTFQSVKN
jgi:hypothetical protein